MLGAGGRDLADEIQVRHRQIIPLIWPENSDIQHTNGKKLCARVKE